MNTVYNGKGKVNFGIQHLCFYSQLSTYRIIPLCFCVCVCDMNCEYAKCGLNYTTTTSSRSCNNNNSHPHSHTVYNAHSNHSVTMENSHLKFENN